MWIMKPPHAASKADAILGKAVMANQNGFARIYSEVDVAVLNACGWSVAGIYAEDEFPALAKASLPRRYKMKRPKNAPSADAVIGRQPQYSQGDGCALVDHDEALRLKDRGWQEAGTLDEMPDKMADAPMSDDAKAIALIKAAHARPLKMGVQR